MSEQRQIVCTVGIGFFWRGIESVGIARDRTDFWLVATPPPPPPINSRTGKAIVSYGLQDFKCGRYIHRMHPN